MKIDFGCGGKPKDGFVGCDVRSNPGVKYVCDCWDIGVYVDECTIDEVTSRHMFEHISFVNGCRTLDAWFKILKSGGRVSMSLPDLHFHVKQYLEFYNNRSQIARSSKKRNFTEYEHAMAGFYGWQREAETEVWDIHKSGYDEISLKEIFEKVGFINFKRLPDKPWNLNVEAYKP